MFNRPKEKFTGIKIRAGGLSLEFGNRFMWLLSIIVICWFISASKEVRVVADDLLSSELGGIKPVLGQLSAALLGHKPAADRATHQIGLTGKEQVQHKAQEYKMIPERAEGSASGKQDVGQNDVEFEHQEVGNTEEAEQTGK